MEEKEEFSKIKEKIIQSKNGDAVKLKMAEDEFKKIDERRNPQEYAELKEEIEARKKEIDNFDLEIKEIENIENEKEKIDLKKLENIEKDLKSKMDKCEEELKKVNEQKDPQMYNEGLEELNRRKKEYDAAKSNLNSAKEKINQLDKNKKIFMKKYKIEENQKVTTESINQESKSQESKDEKQKPKDENKKTKEENQKTKTENHKPKENSALDEQILKKKKELEELRKKIIANGGNMTREQKNKILALKKEIADLKNSKNIPKDENDKSSEHNNLRIEDKSPKKEQLKIEDKSSNILRIEYHPEKEKKGATLPIVHPDVSIEKTGLQIFREQFNEMPEIKKKHSISETPAKYLMSAAGVITAAAIGGGPIGLGIAAAGVAGTAIYSPIAKRLTGQKKLEKQIQEQFEEMDSDEFLKMASYLKEEKIITLKPHCAILNALTKASKTICMKEANELGKESSRLKERKEELANKSNLTIDEKRELSEIGSRIEEIDGHGDKLGEREKLLRTPKEIKRGTKRKSAEYQGNFKGKKIMNLFVRRNHTTEEYKDFLNEYADAERAHDEEMAFSEYESSRGNEEAALDRKIMADKFHDMQKDTMKKYTRVKFGVSLGPANTGEDGTTATVVSDQKDNKIRMATMYGTMGIGLAHTMVTMIDQVNSLNLNADEAERLARAYNGREDELANYIDQLKASGNVSAEDIKKAITSEFATQVNAGEQENLSTFGTASYTNEGYVNADSQLNEKISSMMESLNKEKINNLSTSELLDRLAKEINQSGSDQVKAGDALEGKTFFSGVDHETNGYVNRMSEDGKNVEAELLEKFGNIIKKLEEYKPGDRISANVQRLKENFFGPAMTVISQALRTKEVKENSNESKDKRKQSKDAGLEK